MVYLSIYLYVSSYLCIYPSALLSLHIHIEIEIWGRGVVPEQEREVLTVQLLSVYGQDELTHPEPARLEGSAVGGDVDDSWQFLLGVGAALDGDAQVGPRLLHYNSEPAQAVAHHQGGLESKAFPKSFVLLSEEI